MQETVNERERERERENFLPDVRKIRGTVKIK